MMYFNKLNAAILFLLIVFSACTSNEIGESKDVAQDKIYQQYSISYTEGNEKLSVYAQFRFAGKNGTTLVLTKPSQVVFDDEIIKVDSSNVSGAYYQIQKAVAGFYNKHHFIFTDINNKKFDNDFSFDAFKLVSLPPAVSKKQSFNLLFETTALQPGDYIEVTTNNTDSSFSVTHEAKDGGNFIIIPAKELQRQKGNELSIEATLYRNIPLQQNTAEGGELEIKYALKAVTIRLND